MYYSVKIFNNYIMLLFDLLDAIIKFILAIIPATIALISLFIAYYFYHSKNMNKESFLNYFYNRGCYIHRMLNLNVLKKYALIKKNILLISMFLLIYLIILNYLKL